MEEKLNDHTSWIVDQKHSMLKYTIEYRGVAMI